MPVLVDGYNLLWAIGKTRHGDDSITDVELCRILSRYLKLSGEKGEIVFDGTGPPDKTGFDNISNLEIFFAGLRTDADSIIENKIKASTAPKRLTIVSSDRRLKDAARARKATAIKSEAFWKKVHKQLGRKKNI